MSLIFVGDDWAEGHHDVHVMDENGKRLASGRLPEGLSGVTRCHEMIGAFVDDPAQVIVGIETDRGLWVQALVAAGYAVFAINPLAASRYRDRHHVSGAKSDAADAKMLADLVRTDRHNHRLVAADSSEVEAIKVLARAHQNLVWTRSRHTNQLRSSLREYFPSVLDIFDDLAERDALAILGRAPTPAIAARLTQRQVMATLGRAGRRRNVDSRAAQIRLALQHDQLTAPEPITTAFSATTAALVAILTELNKQLELLLEALTEHFEQHATAGIYRSMPGLGNTLSARVLGEFGDDPERYETAKARKNYAGTSPLTIASGKKRAVLTRHVRNRRLYDAIDQWAFCSLQNSPGCRAYYDQRRAAGDVHHQALRALGNRLVGILHGCLRHGTFYDESTGWAHRYKAPELAAA